MQIINVQKLNLKEVINKMETQDFLETGIGTKEIPTLKPSMVKIASVEIQTETKDKKPMKSPLAHFKVKHPDKEELINITKVKYIRNDKVEVVGLWCNLDEDKNFQKGSAVVAIMEFLKVDNLKATIGNDVELVTQSETDSYLCIKAY